MVVSRALGWVQRRRRKWWCSTTGKAAQWEHILTHIEQLADAVQWMHIPSHMKGNMRADHFAIVGCRRSPLLFGHMLIHPYSTLLYVSNSQQTSCTHWVHQLTPPPLSLILLGAQKNQGWLAGQKGELLRGGYYLTLLLFTRDRAKNIVPGVP